MDLLLPEKFTDDSWKRFVEGVDGCILRAVETYIRSRSLDADAIALGFSEMAKLKAGTEPDYNAPGTAIAYALAYMPRRTCVLAAALEEYAGLVDIFPLRVLDVGSGTDAAAPALDLLVRPNRPSIEIVSLDPCRPMQEFAEGIRCSSKIHRKYVTGTIEDIIDGKVPWGSRPFNLIILSACFPYYSNHPPSWWNALAERINQSTNERSVAIAIAPRKKAFMLKNIKEGLRPAGWCEEKKLIVQDMLKNVGRKRNTLRRLTDLLQKWRPEIIESENLSAGGRCLLDDFKKWPVSSWYLTTKDCRDGGDRETIEFFYRWEVGRRKEFDRRSKGDRMGWDRREQAKSGATG